MLTFSTEGAEADRQMRAVIFYLTTFGYIDGDFDDSEKRFVRDYIKKLVEHRVHGAVDESNPQLRAELITKFTTHFHEVFEGIDQEVQDLFTESVADGEDQRSFVHAKLKLRCFEIFKSFDAQSQEQLMATVDELIHADGHVHPAEAEFRGELAQLLEDDLGVELIEEEDEEDAHVQVSASPAELRPVDDNHPFFEQFEYHYSADKNAFLEQIKADEDLLDRTLALLADQRRRGQGKLSGKARLADIAGGPPFLDGHVYVERPQPGKKYELIVIGDLHGCYSCLKAVLMQTQFFDKVKAYKEDPDNAVCPRLVLLGDYIDRGMFSYNGVLRSVLQTFVAAPEHVYVLRGNHEYYFEYKGDIYGGVKPAEAINTLKPHAPAEVFQHYMKLFDALPNMLFFDRLLFVHGGIPRDNLLKERYKDLASLNDSDIRFQMMWSDPSSADVIPASLQEQSARFPFGRLQCQSFLQRLGAHTLIRGHEKVNEGFRKVYDEPGQLLISLFSAGGGDNHDLPEGSSYRTVTPMALTIQYEDGKSSIEPFRIDYVRYNSPSRNAFFRSRPEIAHQAD